MRRNQSGRGNTSRFNPISSNSRNTGSQLQMPKHFPSRNNYCQPNTSTSLSPEQAAFELEFTKWEKSFNDWKQSYASHPDRMAYKQYEKKFLDVREKLLAKRAQIYKQNVSSELDMHLNAASSMAESILQKFSEPIVIERPLNPRADFGMPNRYQSDYYNRSPPRSSYQMPQWNDRNNYPLMGSNRNFERPNYNRSRSPPNKRNRKNPGTIPPASIKRIKKLQQEIERELKRTDVYPRVPW